MIRPSVYGQAIIILVYVPLLTFQGVEGCMFAPMAITVILALAFAFVLSLTLVPAAIALWLSRPVQEKEGRPIAWAKRRYAPLLDGAIKRSRRVAGIAVALFAGALGLFALFGQEFLPTLDEKDVLVQAWRVPGTSVDQSQAIHFGVEKAIACLPEVRLVFSRTGTAELAADPMPSNATDTFVIMKERSEWLDPSALMLVVEFGTGLVARSSAPEADAVDMLGDALVYVLSLFAIGRGAKWEAGAALVKGGVILLLFSVISDITNPDLIDTLTDCCTQCATSLGQREWLQRSEQGSSLAFRLYGVVSGATRWLRIYGHRSNSSDQMWRRFPTKIALVRDTTENQQLMRALSLRSSLYWFEPIIDQKDYQTLPQDWEAVKRTLQLAVESAALSA